MPTKQDIRNFADEAAAENDAYIVDLTIGADNKILVLADKDTGLALQDCKMINRFIENALGEEHEYALEVSSPGADMPLKLPRQYKKHVGRTLQVTKTDDTVIEAELMASDDEGITIEWKTREKKPEGKGKVTVTHNVNLMYQDIKQTIVLITF